ncbi:MAG: hypothetical protein C0623_10545 [Desulfuromonas sp.]|nr:MAG: hypothetical protein C0623_10545 [Desulfuromonas sp.]
MSYCFSKQLDCGFEEAISRVTAELQKEGFGILSEIDVTAKLKEKIDVDFRPYRILGACNPAYAHKALQAEPNIGTMLPCNVVVQVTDDGRTEVSAIDPVASMQAVNNPGLEPIAGDIRAKLSAVIDRL